MLPHEGRSAGFTPARPTPASFHRFRVAPQPIHRLTTLGSHGWQLEQTR